MPEQKIENWQGDRLREAAEKAGLSASEIAKRMKKSQPLVSRWWLGNRKISTDDLVKYAAIVGVPVDYFLHKEHRLPENQHIRQKIDRIEAELQAVRQAVEAPSGFKTVKATDGTRICIPADSDIDQETIDAMAELQRHGVSAVRESKRA